MKIKLDNGNVVIKPNAFFPKTIGRSPAFALSIFGTGVDTDGGDLFWFFLDFILADGNVWRYEYTKGTIENAFEELFWVLDAQFNSGNIFYRGTYFNALERSRISNKFVLP